MDIHFLQSPEWQKFQESEGCKTLRVKEKNFEYMAIVRSTPLGNYLFVPYGPALKSKKDLAAALDSLREKAKENAAIFVRIEPTLAFTEDEMGVYGLKKAQHVEPEHTWVLDLTQSEEAIFEPMESRKVRFWRNMENRGMTYKISHDPKDVEILYNLLKDLSKVDDFQTFDKEYYEHQMKFDFASLHYIEMDGVPIAASLVYDDADARYYMHAAADFEHRKAQAGSVLLIQLIMEAKEAGKKRFDFWGVTTSEDPSHPWYGFTQYKKSFGGELVTYSGTYDLVTNAAKYKAYGLLRKANRLKRKVLN